MHSSDLTGIPLLLLWSGFGGVVAAFSALLTALAIILDAAASATGTAASPDASAATIAEATAAVGALMLCYRSSYILPPPLPLLKLRTSTFILLLWRLSPAPSHQHS